MTPQASTPPLSGSAPAGSNGGIVKRVGVFVALAALVAIVLMPAAQGLPQAGQVMLGILPFAVIVWMTEALDYVVSAVVIGAFMSLLLAYAPDAANPTGADKDSISPLRFMARSLPANLVVRPSLRLTRINTSLRRPRSMNCP